MQSLKLCAQGLVGLVGNTVLIGYTSNSSKVIIKPIYIQSKMLNNYSFFFHFNEKNKNTVTIKVKYWKILNNNYSIVVHIYLEVRAVQVEEFFVMVHPYFNSACCVNTMSIFVTREWVWVERAENVTHSWTRNRLYCASALPNLQNRPIKLQLFNCLLIIHS